MIDLNKWAELQQKKLSISDPITRFRFFALSMVGAKYELGRENILQTDCSGSVCWPLYAGLSLNIRVNADTLWKELFLLTGHADDYMKEIMAYFFIIGPRATHVSPVVGRGVVLDAAANGRNADIRALEPMLDWYIDNGYSVELRRLDWGTAQFMARDREGSWEIEADEMIKDLFI